MRTDHRSTGSHDLFDSAVKNAIDFLKKSVSELQKSPKYSVINFCSALEIFLKARLMLEHWALIVTKPDTASLVKFRRGDFHSVALDEAIRRLRDIADEPISKEEEKCFQTVREHRNKLVHFFHAKYTSPPEATTIQEIVSEQCKAWFYLYRLLTTRWREHFAGYAKQIKQLNKKMHRNRMFLGAKYDAITPESKKTLRL